MAINNNFGISLLIGLVMLVPARQAGAQNPPDGKQGREAIQTVLIAPKKATLSAPVSKPITKLALHNGDMFERGDVLVAFDCRIERARHDQARASLEAARAKYEARQKLREMQSASRLDFILARAEMEKAEANLRETGARVSQCEMKAPFDGRVTERRANPHEMAEVGQPLISIAGRTRLQARLLVPSNWLAWLEEGHKLDIEVEELGGTYPAHIVRIGGAVDAVSRSIEVVAELDVPPEADLLPGMSGRAVFSRPQGE